MSNKAGITKALDLVPGRCWSRAAAWLWITGLADGQGRAEVSSRKLAAQFGWTRAKTRRFLDRLTDCGLIQRENRQTGPSSSVATICFGKDFPASDEVSGPSPVEQVPVHRTIRAPSAPDKRLAFFAAMVNGAEPVPPGVISPIMAQALVAAGAVSIEALRRKGVST